MRGQYASNYCSNSGELVRIPLIRQPFGLPPPPRGEGLGAVIIGAINYNLNLAQKKQEELFMHDIIIIGGGPAGLTAAVYALRAGKTVLVIEKNGFGGQIA